MELDGKKVINNIYWLAKEQKVKIGDLEVAAGVSSGYLSKIAKEEIATIPGAEILYKISRKLMVSVDNLLTINYSNINPTEKYLFDFLEKLIDSTNQSKIDWKLESPSLIRESYECHPLYKRDFDGYVYDSKFWDYKEDCGAYPVDNFYSFSNNNCTYYIVQVCITIKNKQYIGFEMYAETDNATKKVCCTGERPSPIDAQLKQLYFAVKDYLLKPKIDEDVKMAIDLFMGEEL